MVISGSTILPVIVDPAAAERILPSVISIAFLLQVSYHCLKFSGQKRRLSRGCRLDLSEIIVLSTLHKESVNY
jgi:hypothetical protein